MPFSHHSHSGQYCNHAVDQLEEVVQEAIRQGMQTFAMTEHMPRNEEADLYPGEIDSGWSLPEQAITYDNFYHTARQLQEQYKDKIDLLVGMEIDWIRPASKEWIQSLLKKYELDVFVGSVHHVHGIPIDFDHDHYVRAVQASASRADNGNTAEEVLFEGYFDAQFAMLQALKPPIVGHFDLIRLLSNEKDQNWRHYPKIWEKIIRNLHFVKDYGGLLELNSSALRKGLKEPYPKLEICECFYELGGKFVFSDDSHGIKQIGHSYEGLFEHAVQAGVRDLAVLSRRGALTSLDQRFPGIGLNLISITTIRDLDFWKRRAL